MTDGHRRGRRLAVAVAASLALLWAVPAPASADVVRDRQWHLDALGVAAAQKISRGDGVVVCVIDTGVWAGHPDLRGQVLPGKRISVALPPPGNPGDGRVDEDTGTGHGTSMAALIAAHGHGAGGRDGALGIAPGARILPVVTDGTRIDMASPLQIGQAIRYCVDHGAGVVNMSFVIDDRGLVAPPILSAIRHAADRDAVLVAGTGNSGKPVARPADIPGVVAVGAVDRNDRLWAQSNRGPQVALTAPGVDVVMGGRRPAYGISSGTSASTAIVAGVAALIRARYPDASAAEVVNRMTATARDEGAPGRDPLYGFGIVDPYAALTADVPAPAANPVGTPPPPQATAPPAAATGFSATELGLLAVAIAVPVLGVLVVAAIILFVVLRRRTAR